MQRDPRTYLWDALHAADLVAEFTRNKTFADYESDALNQLAKVDAELAEHVPELGDIVGFRNILAHGYAVVDDALVWRATVDKVPPLRAVLRTLLDAAGG